MQLEQSQWKAETGWQGSMGTLQDAQLVVVFGSKDLLSEGKRLDELRNSYPNAHITGCSTAGEIWDVHVNDHTLVATAIHFDSTRVVGTQVSLDDVGGSKEAGVALAKSLESGPLAHVFVLSDGINVNGSELVEGILQEIPQGVQVTGGLSGDGSNFQDTLVVSGEQTKPNMVSLLAFYGERIKIGCGSLGGWDPFGPERLITRSEGNVLYELDGMSALELYRKYLGEHASGLPATGLLFPLTIRTKGSERGLVRTILSISEKDQSLTFAGDIPQGCYARLMKANFDRLVDGASGAAKTSYLAVGETSPDFAVLVSCVGRKMVLKQRVEEEVEAVREVLGDRTVLTGFLLVW